MLPEPTRKRLEKYGYGTESEILGRIAARIIALPGVSNDPVTKSAIDIILRMELNPNAEPIEFPEDEQSDTHGVPPGTPVNPQRGYRGTDSSREVTDVPGF